MKKGIMICAGIVGILTACEQTEIREITEDRYVPQPVDTVKVTDNYYLDGYTARTAADLGEGRTLQAVNLCLDEGELYVANAAGSCVAAPKRFAFVRDSKEQNVRVFDREAVSLTVANNNAVFARLSTPGNFIGSGTEPQGDSYDMEVIGDSLYAFIPRSGIVYAWKTSEIEAQKDNTPTSITTPTGVKIRSVAKGKDDSSLFVAMEKDGKMQLAEITLADFQSRNFSRPIRQFTADSRVALPSQPIITYFNERLILTNSDKLERWEIRNNPSYVIRPGGK